MKEPLAIIPLNNIRTLIYTIRGEQVMLDSDLAEIYGVETKAFNRAVKRNSERFPSAFCFQITQEEDDNLRCQIGTSSSDDSLRCQIGTLEKGGRGQHRKYLPYAFTEQGVSMLSAVLRSETAVKVSIQIINAFVEMRRFLQGSASVFARLDTVEKRQLAFESKTAGDFEKVFQALEAAEPPRQGIFYDGQVYDAHTFASDLIRKARKSLILVDNYVDDTVLTLLTKRKKGVAATLFTKSISKQLALDLEKHNAQYPLIEIKTFKDAHDRFLIIDEREIYHIGASLKDLGKKWFAFSRFETGALDMLKKLGAARCAQLDMDKLISRHCAILGATGSGKSNAVSIVVKAIAEKPFPSARVLMIDPHGEYASSLAGKCRVFRVGAVAGEDELCVPFWALPFKELMAIFPGRLSDQNEDYIRGKVLDIKRVSAAALGGLRAEAITADSPIPFSINQLWFDLDNFERTTFQANRTTPEALISVGDPATLTSNQYPTAGLGASAPFLNTKAKGILGFLDGMRSRLLDQSYNFLFRPVGYTPALNGTTTNDLPQLFSTWFGHGFPIAILDLSAIPSEIMQTISGCILKIIYDALYWGQNTLVGGKKQPLFIVLDEAHAYLKAGEDSISSRTVQAVAKEGRKYGVGMMLVTQRPSELDETVLSQCGSIIALRMTNTRDKGHVSSAMQDELREMADVLSSLRTGEAIISGEAVRIPSRVKFFQADNAVKSSDPIASKLWANPQPDVAVYETSVRNWRNQSFN